MWKNGEKGGKGKEKWEGRDRRKIGNEKKSDIKRRMKRKKGQEDRKTERGKWKEVRERKGGEEGK